MANRNSSAQSVEPLIGKLQLCTGLGTFLSDQRIRLLEAIKSHGSLSAAAKSLPMSYKAAWEALDSMNNLAEEPLVIRTTGGKNGGGTVLTEYGLKLISMYKAMEREYQATLDQLQHMMLNADASGSVEQFRHLIRRVNFRSSARNQLAGKVTAVTMGAVNVLVELKVSDSITILASVTRESAEALEIEYGREFVALIKSSQMILLDDDSQRISASNQLPGVVSHIQQGVVCSDISIALADQKSVGVTITRESVDNLHLQEGSKVTVCFKASSVILCRYD